jgi:UDP-glucose 4-epimerase
MKVWVIGRGGLLGNGVEKQFRFGDIYSPNEKLVWSDSAQLQNQIAENCRQFSQVVSDSQWTIFWCAGKGTLSSTTEQMSEETRNFQEFLKSVEQNFALKRLQNGLIFYASSAGGIYAGSENQPFTENTTPKPTTAYGVAKLDQEDLLRGFSDRLGVRIVVGRISNLYGANQDFSKNQGLISTICYSILRRQPINLFVPLETSRNYVYVADASRIIVEAVKIALADAGSTNKFIKLVVADENLTVGNIISIAKTVFRVRPLITASSNAKINKQPQSINFKSVALVEADSFCKTRISVGLKRVMADLHTDILRNGAQRAREQ